MGELQRRDFLRLGLAVAFGCGLNRGTARVLAEGLAALASGTLRVIWLEAQSCSGCSVSLLNSDNPGPAEVLTRVVSMIFHPTVSATQGHQVSEVLAKARQSGDYVLAIEGAIPVGMPSACMLEEQPFATAILPYLRQARAVVAMGSCAAHGGIPAAEGNPTGAVSVGEFMRQQGIARENKLVNCPSCPTHPESIVGTLAWLGARGYPPVHPTLYTPEMFYSMSTHDECPRFHAYDKKEFATKFGEAHGCLFKLGCLGPLSFTNCPTRQWNGGVNWCIRASAPCIGCTSPEFALRKAFPFYRVNEATGGAPTNEADRGRH